MGHAMTSCIRALWWATLAALSGVAGCQDAPATGGLDTLGAGEVAPADVPASPACDLCGGTCCGLGESCELLDFQPACVCGGSPSCSGGRVCVEWESGDRLCTQVLDPGEPGCTDPEHRCAEGAACVATTASAGTCHALCKTGLVLCGTGAICQALADPKKFAPYDGVCKVGGETPIGRSCSNQDECSADSFCVDGFCRMACKLGAPGCPPGDTCSKLVGEDHVGACL